MNSPDPKLDALLHSVPLPDGLLDRLRAIAVENMGQREVIGHRELIGQRTGVVQPEDEGLDAALREVAIPPDLEKRLQLIPLEDDAGLDEILRDVPVPSRLAVALRRRKPGRRVVRYGRFVKIVTGLITVAAALVLLAIPTNFFGKFFGSSRADKQIDQQIDPGQQALDSHRKSGDSLKSSWSDLSNGGISNGGASNGGASNRGASNRGVAANDSAHRVISPALPDVGPVKIDIAPGSSALARLDSGMNLPRSADPLEMPNQVVVAPPNPFDELPELPRKGADLNPRGLDWPIVPGSNVAFLMEKGFLPFVSPTANSRLQTCYVPLGVDTSSYELARRYLEHGELPPADRVRTEEFLAAIDYDFPEPSRQNLGLTIAGGPSPISGEGYSLLQVGIQARHIGTDSHAPAHLIFLVDTSTSMQWGSRIEVTRRALAGIARRLGSADRVSLVSFNHAAHVLVQDVGVDEIDQFDSAVDSLEAQGSTDLYGGLREAYSLAREVSVSGRPQARVILITDGLLELDRDWTARIGSQVAEAAGHGVRLNVIDLGQRKQSDPELAAFAKLGHGNVQRATTADRIRWAVQEILSGRSQLMARDARLQVTFNPKSVLEYRLLGHEAGEWAGMLPGPLAADFREGQSATALYEVRLAPDGPSEVANVELTWSKPDGDKQITWRPGQKSSVRAERKDFASNLSGTAVSLQAASVVAYTAEVLRRSPFLFSRLSHPSFPTALFHALEISGRVDSRLMARPSYAEFVAMIQMEMRAHPARKGAERD